MHEKIEGARTSNASLVYIKGDDCWRHGHPLLVVLESAMTETSARVITDSISPEGIRLTSVVVTLHRFVLSELNTHRVFSRNSASSRAIPVSKMLANYIDDPALPIIWGAEQPGMQAGGQLTGQDLTDAEVLFQTVHELTFAAVDDYLLDHENPGSRLHKSLINRLLEPFLWHTVLITSTEWDNFYNLRCHPAAQPEIRVAAELIRDAITKSVPQLRTYGQWHLPFVDFEHAWPNRQVAMKASVARCAWVSTMAHDRDQSIEAIERMYQRLVTADPMHASPLEHQAIPDRSPDRDRLGNFRGWMQLRHLVETGLQL